ncbi:hypothetical protein [Mesorhizobium sp. M0767]|uniref:hypothetical protein n=1 Tax=Mesorhizobium sp. M0767 TaxID=2956995 RepID=UPI003338EE58
MTKYFVDASGKYLGGWDGSEPPLGAIEVPSAPENVSQLWAGNAWAQPTEEDLRALLTPLTPRQLCMMLPVLGLSEAAIATQIEAIPDATDRLRADIEWRKATSFSRNHPLVLSLSAALQFEPSELDDLWVYASTI